MKFINRQNELEFLEKAYNSKGFQFIPIYGRRRIGKTELVKQFLKNKKAFYYLADTLEEKTQLKILGENAGDFFDDFLLKEQGFRDWYSLFKFLKMKSDETNDKIVVIIDEFPYLVKANSAISSIFQKGIDEYLKYTDIFLVIMGSLIGMMEKEVLNYPMAWGTYMLRNSFVLVFVRFLVKARADPIRFEMISGRWKTPRS
jgi:AAA+ ATPase superfamily predicted ATPase